MLLMLVSWPRTSLLHKTFSSNSSAPLLPRCVGIPLVHRISPKLDDSPNYHCPTLQTNEIREPQILICVLLHCKPCSLENIWKFYQSIRKWKLHLSSLLRHVSLHKPCFTNLVSCSSSFRFCFFHLSICWNISHYIKQFPMVAFQ